MISDNQLFSGLYEIRHGNQDDPAVASGFTLTAPENGRSELIALTFKLVTDANVANRIVSLRHQHGGNPIYLATAPVAHVALTTNIYLLNPGHPYRAALTTGFLPISLPRYPAIFEDDTIEIIVSSIAAGDQISEIAFTWKRWLIK